MHAPPARGGRHQEALALVREWRKQRSSAPCLRTVSDALDLYLAALESRAARDLVTMGYRVHWVRESLGDLPLAEVTVPLICAWIETVRPHMPPNTLHGRVDALRSALEEARRVGAILRNPARQIPAGVLPPRKSLLDPETELLSGEEIMRLAPSPRFPIWLSLALTGVRLGELLELRTHDIDTCAPDLWRITVSRSWSRKRGAVDVTKSDSTRTVPVHPQLRPRLAVLLSGRPGTELLFEKKPSPKHRAHQIKDPHLNDKTLITQFHRDLEDAGLEPRRIHSLRHTFVSLALSGGAREEVVESMTHPRRTTRRRLSVYAHYSWASKCEAIRNIEIGGAVGAQLDLFGGTNVHVAATTQENRTTDRG